MEAWFARSVARQFLDASNRCLRDERQPPTARGPALVPAVVCAAFAAEVGLKAILIGEGSPSDGHKLNVLFRRLSQASKQELVRQTGYTQERFDAELPVASNAFVEWRYVYEEHASKSVSQQFLLLLATAAIKVAERFNAA